MPEPVIEQVAAALLTRVATVTTDNGYQYTLTPLRPGHRNVSYRHLSAEVWVESADDLPAEYGNDVIWPLLWRFVVAVYVAPDSEEDDTPIDRYLLRIWADVVKAVAADWAEGGTLASLAYNWTPQAPVLDDSDDGAFSMLIVPFAAVVRTDESDPYTQR